jgi:hypothetical protein
MGNFKGGNAFGKNLILNIGIENIAGVTLPPKVNGNFHPLP